VSAALGISSNAISSDVTSHPSLEDGDLTVYFQTEATRRSYVDMPLNHPNLHLPYPAAGSDDRGG
jgi:hypothetical protein